MREPLWLESAKALSFGTKRKIKCVACHTDSTLMISHAAKGYNAYCFRGSCGLNEFHPHGMLSLAQLAERRLATTKLYAEKSVALPSDCTTELPVDARLWLLRAGISDHLRTSYGLQWSPYFSRLIIPILKRGYLARSLTTDGPKYIAKLSSNAEIFQSKEELTLKDAVTEIDAVVVEDVLSAIRVGRVAKSQAILGTAFGDGISAAVMAATGKQNPVICVWTDGDKAGRNSRLRIRAGLSLQGCRVVSVQTTKDPKFHSNREIRECLRASLLQL